MMPLSLVSILAASLLAPPAFAAGPKAARLSIAPIRASGLYGGQFQRRESLWIPADTHLRTRYYTWPAFPVVMAGPTPLIAVPSQDQIRSIVSPGALEPQLAFPQVKPLVDIPAYGNDPSQTAAQALRQMAVPVRPGAAPRPDNLWDGKLSRLQPVEMWIKNNQRSLYVPRSVGLGYDESAGELKPRIAGALDSIALQAEGNRSWLYKPWLDLDQTSLNSEEKTAAVKAMFRLMTQLPDENNNVAQELGSWINRASQENSDVADEAFIQTLEQLPQINQPNIHYDLFRRLVQSIQKSSSRRSAAILHFIKKLEIPLEKAADQLLNQVMRLPDASHERTEDLAALLQLTATENPEKNGHLWPALVVGFMNNTLQRPPSLSRAKVIPFGPQITEFEKELPTLAAILKNPDKAARFLSLLSFMRMIYPYYLANNSLKAPLEWALEHKIYFPINEFFVVPVSESFKRHIIVNPKTGYAVELKIPGEETARDMLDVSHYTAAEWLWTKFPHHPGTVAPVQYLSFTGKVWLYGKYKDFPKSNPLEVMVLRYEDGKRLSNAGPMFARLAKETGQSVIELIREAKADAAAISIRLHRGGWHGTRGIQSDMHPENIRVLRNGHGVLVGDFGAYHKTKKSVSRKKRLQETMSLVGKMVISNDPSSTARAIWEPISGNEAKDLVQPVALRLTVDEPEFLRSEEIGVERFVELMDEAAKELNLRRDRSATKDALRKDRSTTKTR